MTGFFMGWLDERELLLTRMELSLEAARDPELADLLAAFHRRLVGLVESILSARGKDRGRRRGRDPGGVVRRRAPGRLRAVRRPSDDRSSASRWRC